MNEDDAQMKPRLIKKQNKFEIRQEGLNRLEKKAQCACVSSKKI